MSNQIRILALRVMQPPKVEMIDSDLKAMQKFVGGYITCPSLAEDIDMVCNDEGLFTEKPNRAYPNGEGIFYGDCFVARVDFETGKYINLTYQDVLAYTEMFKDFIV